MFVVGRPLSWKRPLLFAAYFWLLEVAVKAYFVEVNVFGVLYRVVGIVGQLKHVELAPVYGIQPRCAECRILVDRSDHNVVAAIVPPVIVRSVVGLLGVRGRDVDFGGNIPRIVGRGILARKVMRVCLKPRFFSTESADGVPGVVIVGAVPRGR